MGGWVFSKDKKSKFAVCENAGTTNGGTMTKTNSKSAPFSPIGTPGQCKTPTTSFVTLSTAEECTKLKTNCPSTCNRRQEEVQVGGTLWLQQVRHCHPHPGRAQRRHGQGRVPRSDDRRGEAQQLLQGDCTAGWVPQDVQGCFWVRSGQLV